MNGIMRNCYSASALSRVPDSVPMSMLRSGCLSSCSMNSVSVPLTFHAQMVSASIWDQVSFLFKSLVSSIAHGTQEVLTWHTGSAYMATCGLLHPTGIKENSPKWACHLSPIITQTFSSTEDPVFVKNPFSQLQRSKTPWNYCSLMENNRLCGQAFLGLNLGFSNYGPSCLDKFLTFPEPQFPLHWTRIIIHAIHLFSKYLLGTWYMTRTRPGDTYLWTKQTALLPE